MEIMHQHRQCSLSGSLKGFVTLAKQKNPGIVLTHSFLHKEALISKSVQKVLDAMIKMVNYIKSMPLQSRLFSVVFCHGSCSHTTPTAYGSEAAILRS
jgi:hypothetical protein